MKYAVVKVVNGNFSIDSEGYTDPQKAVVNFHQTCAALWNAEDANTFSVRVVDESFRQYDRYYDEKTATAEATE